VCNHGGIFLDKDLVAIVKEMEIEKDCDYVIIGDKEKKDESD
jgi:hypothetical protein